MINLFLKYTSVGVINTLIHWLVFSVCIYGLHVNQAMANFSGFVFAVTCSFFINARYTFKAGTTTLRYMIYVGFMGALSLTVGRVADRLELNPVITLISFSLISLVIGFIYSRYIVFRDTK